MFAKRISMSLLAIGVISLVVSAASFALFTATSTNANNTFTAGTVTLDDPVVYSAVFDNIAPGDSDSYTIEIKYTGTLDAWLGASAAVSGGLTSCDGGGHFDAAVNGVNADGNKHVIGLVNPNQTTTVDVDWSFDLAAGNPCQGESATISVTFHAVQARNNTNGTNDGPISWN